jgi:hypothetical protein
MAIGFKKVYSTEGIPAFQRVLENAQGGFTLDMTAAALSEGEEVKKGSLIMYDEETRKGTLVRTARVYEAGTGVTAVKVEKDHNMVVGADIDGVAVNAINTDNADYDVLTLASAVDVAAGDILATADVTGKQTGLLYEGVKAEENATLSVVIRGTVYANRIPPVDADQVPATLILSNSN